MDQVVWQVPEVSEDRRLVAGVAAGIAEELGVEPVVTRASFVLLTLAGGWGLLALRPLLGLVQRRRVDPSPEWTVDTRRARATPNESSPSASSTLGLLLMIRTLGLGFVDSVVWPTGIIAVGALVVWHRQGDPTMSVREGHHDVLRAVTGVVIAGAGFVGMLLINVDWGSARTSLLLLAVVILGVGLLLGPWAWRLVDDLSEERLARIRADERARGGCAPPRFGFSRPWP